jgi:hypothetical protein
MISGPAAPLGWLQSAVMHLHDRRMSSKQYHPTAALSLSKTPRLCSSLSTQIDDLRNIILTYSALSQLHGQPPEMEQQHHQHHDDIMRS